MPVATDCGQFEKQQYNSMLNTHCQVTSGSCSIDLVSTRTNLPDFADDSANDIVDYFCEVLRKLSACLSWHIKIKKTMAIALSNHKTIGKKSLP